LQLVITIYPRRAFYSPKIMYSLKSRTIMIDKPKPRKMRIDQKVIYVGFVRYSLGFVFECYNKKKQLCSKYIFTESKVNFTAPHYIGLNCMPNMNTANYFIINTSKEEFEEFKNTHKIPTPTCTIVYTTNTIKEYITKIKD